jgi:hypothetical protein
MHALSLPSVRRNSRALALFLTLLCASAPALVRPLAAQSVDTESSRRERSRGDGIARAISLIVQPKRADVFRLHLRQEIEISGTRRETPAIPGERVSPTAAKSKQRATVIGPRRNATPTRVTIMDFYAKSTVEQVDGAGAVVSAVTDSLVVRAGELGETLRAERVPIAAGTAPTRIRVKENGAMLNLDPATGVTASLAAMPALLPDQPVRVGDQWEREIAIPALPLTTYRADGVLHAVFQLDSTSRDGRDAHVSVTGTLKRDGSARELPPGSRVITAGTMTGALVLDRQRGWIVDARTTIDVQSEVVSADAAPAMQLDIRITQRLRVR